MLMVQVFAREPPPAVSPPIPVPATAEEILKVGLLIAGTCATRVCFDCDSGCQHTRHALHANNTHRECAASPL